MPGVESGGILLMAMAMAKPKTVALLIDSSTSWGTSIIQGIARYAEQCGNWVLHLGQYGKHEDQPLPKLERLDGCIARVTSEHLADEILAAKLPAVNVSWYRHGEGRIPTCTADGAMAGEMAACYFLERDYTRFAYCGPAPSKAYVNRCRERFLEVVRQAGFTCHVIDAVHPPRDEPWDHFRARLVPWVASLEKPVAVLSFDAMYGRELTEACALSGARVPEDVAVLSGEHDELFTSLSVPHLSAIDLSPRRIGYQAAELLDRLLSGERPPAVPVLIPPAGILSSQSSDVLATADPIMRAALSYIRRHAGEPIQVSDVVEHMAISRRLLEQRFRVTLKRSPAAEIRRVRLELARKLLSDGDLSISAVATRSGFEHPEVFARIFRRQYGVSPSDYRLRQMG